MKLNNKKIIAAIILILAILIAPQKAMRLALNSVDFYLDLASTMYGDCSFRRSRENWGNLF